MPVSPPSTSRHRAATSRRSARPARRRLDALWTIAIGVPLGLLACGGLVWQASYAAFTATTTNEPNAWTTGSVALVDDDLGAALFTVSGLTPSATVQGTKCIKVTSSGTVASNIKMYATVTGDTTLAQNLDITVEHSAVNGGGTFNSCTGFTGTSLFTGTLAAFGTTHSSWANGAGSWSTAVTASRTYRVTYKLNINAPNTVQTKTAGVTFFWEAQST
ncbi:hypothetical protein [Cellulomonas sp. S1-8]|uniref:hypothetical protein n=1 Tax=Cellulomonas sp. S1-8 TaxID=2904790 RepID=UPI002243A83C|nr:hypothetical protein [Cellulomonas sp. S1-8]UZN02928.1 hypothetical protein OKX07_18040 [Cellulomonas sp. S1-8]